MSGWLSAVTQRQQQGDTSVVVSIVRVEGSSPRGVGTRMVVNSDTQYGTIGGGNLEYQALKTAREILSDACVPSATRQPVIQQIAYTLGEDLVQCCGGRVTLMYEVFFPVPAPIVIFGAGHVGRELVQILARLPLSVTWFDERPAYVEQANAVINQSVADITVELLSQPYVAVEQCPGNALYVVLTHSHALDFELVEAIVSRDDTGFCGLIASASKAAAFRSRLRRKGFTPREISRLTAPIGVAKDNDSAVDTAQSDECLEFAALEKEPMLIALGIAQQLLSLPAVRSSQNAPRSTSFKRRIACTDN